MSRIPQPGQQWRKKPNGLWCRVVKVERQKALMLTPSGRSHWVSFDTLWREWECATVEVSP